LIPTLVFTHLLPGTGAIHRIENLSQYVQHSPTEDRAYPKWVRIDHETQGLDMKFRAISGFVGFAMLTLAAGTASAQLLRPQCPLSTNLHPSSTTTKTTCRPNPRPGRPQICTTTTVVAANPAIKCQEVSGGDGYATMGDGSQTYLFGFGPLSGLDQIAKGKPGTQPAGDFLNAYNMPDLPGVDANNGNATMPDPTYKAANPQSPNGGLIDAAEIMNVGVLAAQQPAPLIAIDEDDELFLTLSNVGMIMRPDLFEQHTIHFHGYPNASSYFDGVPDASIAIAISGSMTYYYTAPDAGTNFWHCHITPPEHLQMGMVGQLYVRPRQNAVADGAPLYAALKANNVVHGLSPDGLKCADILCTGATPAPVADLGAKRNNALVTQTVTDANGVTTTAVVNDPTNDKPLHAVNYAYNDGDGTTAYDVEYPLQLMGFDPAFHYVGMTFNPEDFSGMKDKYFMISGRSYPDTVSPDVIRTQASDGLARPSQVVLSKITLKSCASDNNGCEGVQHRALLRISDLTVTEFHTLASNLPMQVIGWNARLLRDMAGHNLYYNSNSITMGGGESADVIIRSDDVPPGTYFVYTTNLDHLSNDAENVGGMMTEILVQ
jgi:hypothetical protein